MDKVGMEELNDEVDDIFYRHAVLLRRCVELLEEIRDDAIGPLTMYPATMTEDDWVAERAILIEEIRGYLS